MYRAALTYHPAIGTFRGQRGAWRVSACWPEGQALPIRVGASGRLLISVTQPLHPQTFTNPTALLRKHVLVASR